MSPFAIVSTLFNLFSSISSSSASSSSQAETARPGKTDGGDFASSLSSQVAALQMQSNTPLPGQISGSGKMPSNTDPKTGTTDPFSILGMLQTTQSLPSNWRKLTQFSEANGINGGVAAIQQASQSLARITATMDAESITSQLQTFATKYNEWVSASGGTAKADGLQAGPQVANSAIHKLEQDVKNMLDDAKLSLHNLHDLGFSIDQNTNLATVDTTKLGAALTANKTGAINSIQEFSTKFANSTELLNLVNSFSLKSSAYLNKALATYAQTSHST